jgi:hypothetical protein
MRFVQRAACSAHPPRARACSTCLCVHVDTLPRTFFVYERTHQSTRGARMESGLRGRLWPVGVHVLMPA